MADRRQLALDLPHRPAFGREDFLVAPCNHEAVDWVDLWPNWPAPVLVLCGPPGAGKTHLAAVWQARAGATGLSPDGLSGAALESTGDPPHHVLEDAVTIADEDALFHLYNRIAERAGTLLLTATEPPARWSLRLDDLASRLRAAPVATIGRPDDALIQALMVKMFTDRQLRISPDVIAFLVPRMERSFEAARTLVAELDRAALAQRRIVTIPLARAVLEEFTLGE